MEAVTLAGFARAEADRLFGAPPPGLAESLPLTLRPPAEVRAAFIARHESLLAAF
jgi:hypothetical protein